MNHAIAVCDVDKEVLAKAVKAVEQTGRKCDAYSDYRQVLERKDVDAVVISTPDHWHALMTIHACEAGKDVYCEKPLSLTISEGRKMVQAARKHERIVQTGSQQRSDAKFRQACELVRSGRIGKLETILVGIPGPNHPGEPVADSTPPAELDYDLWLGPAPRSSLQREARALQLPLLLGLFRRPDDQLRRSPHRHRPLGNRRRRRRSARNRRRGDVPSAEVARGVGDVPRDLQVSGRRHDDRRSETEGHSRRAATFIGSKGKIYVTRGKIVGEPADVLSEPLGESDVKLYVSGNHHQNFLECFKSRELPICDVEIGHRTATACHLGNIAIRTGRKIRWDSAKEQIVGDDAAQAMTQPKYRSPWNI